jgi:hypothetical protein
MERGFINDKLMARQMMICPPSKQDSKSPLTIKSIKKRKVCFETNAKAMPNLNYHQERSLEDIKTSWYSREELMESCSEAKRIVGIINSVDGDMDAIDHTQVCVIGLEKFHGKKERDNYRKLLIRSIMIRQEMNRGLGLGHNPDCFREISQMISASFKEIALWQASMHKFHAYGTPSTKSQPKSHGATKDLAQFGSNKRQRLNNGFQITSTPASKPLQQDTAEIRKIMTQYCSR